MPPIEVIEMPMCRCGAAPKLVEFVVDGRKHTQFICSKTIHCLRGDSVVMAKSHKAWAKHHAAMGWIETIQSVQSRA